MIMNTETIEQINEMESTELVHAAIRAGLFGMQTEFVKQQKVERLAEVGTGSAKTKTMNKVDKQIINELRRRHITIKILQSNVYQVSADKPNKVLVGGEIFEFE